MKNPQLESTEFSRLIEVIQFERITQSFMRESSTFLSSVNALPRAVRYNRILHIELCYIH